MCFFFFKQKTAYEMRISDWSSDVCSSDLDVLDQRPWEEAILFAVERSARGDAIYKAACSAAIRAAFEVDPVLAGEMIFRATDEVWAPIGTEMRSLAEQWHAPGDRKSTRLNSSH